MDMRKQFTVANIITILRLIGIPFMVYLIFKGTNRWLAFSLFVIIWATDFLDGYIARHYNQITTLGTLLDPVVDKLFQFSVSASMFIVGRLPIWVPIFIFCKEFAMVTVGFLLFRQRKVISAKWFGKLATVMFACAFAILFIFPELSMTTVSYIFAAPVFMSFIAFVSYAIVVVKLKWAEK